MRTTSAFEVVVAGGRIDAATQSRSTPKGEQLVAHCGIAPAPCVRVVPWSVDFQTSACSGAAPWLPARLHMYTALAWSVARQSSPLLGSAVVTCFQVVPRSVDVYVTVPPLGVES